MSSAAARIVLVDDHVGFRGLVRALIEAEADFEVVAEVGSVIEALHSAEAHRPDVIVLDLGLGDRLGLGLIEPLRGLGCAVVVLSMHAERAYVREALALGASGYVRKDTADRDLVPALRRAIDVPPREPGSRPAGRAA
jgi:DNA-binding NarL/FixJ family response regulator